VLLSWLLGALLLVEAAASGPEAFFVGRFESEGTVDMILAGRHGVRVRSRGRMAPDGALIIEQVVEEHGKPPRNRSWRLVRGAGNRVTGSVSDARGPVAGEISGNVLHLRYRTEQNLSVEQWITVHPNRRSARNRMVFKRFGIRVATYEEMMRRVD
jgi:hypothetical protein